jgi:hypothetical protein
MDQELVDVLAGISVAGRISEGDVMRLRDTVWTEETLAQPVVDALFDLNARCRDAVPAWSELLCEAVEHYLLHQTQPHGFLDENGATWLRDRIGRNGRIQSYPEMELLVTILENAENAPDWLKAWALSEIEETIVSGVGPTRDATVVVPNVVDEVEVDLLRRLIFAGGGEGAIVVGTAEANLLFRIKDRTLGSENDTGWLTLFVQGVGNHLMAHSDYRPLSRDEALRLNAFMEDHASNLFGFLGRTLPGHMFGRGTIAEAFKSLFVSSEDHFGDDAEIAKSHALTAEEAGWLKEHIAVDGQTDDYEKALLTFVVEETGNLPSMLEGLRRRA